MKRKHVVIIAAALVLAVLAGACTRPASDGAAGLGGLESELPNPVATQSELMREIIAGTQTAMAIPLVDTEDETVEGEEAAEAEEPVAAATAEPTQAATPIPLPTSTPGPPPVVELAFNTKKCPPGFYICVVDTEVDQNITLQVSPWLLYNMDLTFMMGPSGLFDYNKYIVVGTTVYKPDGSQGYGFEVELNIPDSLRGTENIVVRLQTDNVNYWGQDVFPNK